MIKYIRRFFCLVAFCIAAQHSPAQYYDWGQNPASIKWLETKTPEGKYVFPEYYAGQAARVINYMDTVRPYVGHGFTYGPMKLPLVVHSQNFESNGLVLMAPRRMEFIVTPSSEIAAMPWLKQLSVHEFRHSVQYNNLNRGLIKVLSYVVGQQGSMIGAGLLPYWFLEGDAVMAETQMSSYGRGLQPSFTMQFRAFCLEDMRFSEDQYFCGSFRYPMPNQYNLGYQVVSWADTKYGHNIWNKVARYASRNPYFFFTNYFGLRKYYDTSSSELFNEAFDDLWRFWRSQPAVENTSQIIASEPVRSFTTYTSPVAADDGSLLVMKEDLRRPNRIVLFDMATGVEKRLTYTGQVSSPMTRAGDRLYWTEYRQSTFWQQRVNSQLCYYDLATGRKGSVRNERQTTFPVAMDGGGYAAVEYDYAGQYSIKYGDKRLAMPDTISVHGLAFDAQTARFYFIGLSDAGMWIGQAPRDLGCYEIVTRPNFSSIANLRAAGGKLFYNSIATGKDEAHMYDLATGREWAITESKYGSFSPAPVDGGVALSTYTKDGYMLALQPAGDEREVGWSHLPKNTVNPSRRKWEGVINIDTIRVADTTPHKSKRYRRGLNLFQVHSWAPFYFDPDELVKEAEFTFGAGVTMMSQNLLNSTFSQMGWKYTGEGSLLLAKFNYYGWAPKFEVAAEWGTMDQLDYRSPLFVPFDADYKLKNYFDIQARAYLPILLSSGYHIRQLTPEISFEHNNARMIYPEDEIQHVIPGPNGEQDAVSYMSFSNGMQKASIALQYSDNVRQAYRDFLPRWGYTVRVSGSANPFSSHFKNLYMVYGRVYLPGVAPHHSLMLRGVAQKSTGEGVYGFSSKDLFPRGADYNAVRPGEYSALSADYQLPIAYPDFGIPSVLYIARIRLRLGADVAFWDTPSLRTGERREWSFGGALRFDIIPLSMPFHSQGSLEVGVWKPSSKDQPVVQVGFSLPL